MSLTKVSYSMIDGAPVSVKDFGAVGDGVTDDTAAIQAAIDYASTTGGNQVLFPSGRYNTSSTINITADGISLVGHGERNTIIQPFFSGGDVILVAPTGGATRLDCFAMDGFTIDPPTAFPRTSGAHINLTSAYQANVSNIEFRDCFVGLKVTGANSAHQVFENLIMRGIIAGTGIGILLENGIDQMFNYISINNGVGFEPLAGIKIEQNQALWIDNSDILRCQYGMLIAPGVSQLVTWSFISNTAFDYCSIDGVRISPFDNSSVINGLQFVGCWTSSCTQRGFHITKAGATTVDNIPKGIKLNSHRAVNNGSNGFLATTGTQIDIANSYFGGNGKTTAGTIAGIQFNDILYFSVTTSGSGWQFGYSSTIQVTGLTIAGASNFYRIIGNDFYGNVVKGLSDTSSSTVKQVFGNTPATDREDTFTLGSNNADSLKSIMTATATWDPATVLAGGYASRSITVSGAAVGDVATATLSSIGFNDFLISSVVADANEVRVIIQNIDSSPIDLPSGTLNVMVTKLGF